MDGLPRFCVVSGRGAIVAPWRATLCCTSGLLMAKRNYKIVRNGETAVHVDGLDLESAVRAMALNPGHRPWVEGEIVDVSLSTGRDVHYLRWIGGNWVEQT